MNEQGRDGLIVGDSGQCADGDFVRMDRQTRDKPYHRVYVQYSVRAVTRVGNGTRRFPDHNSETFLHLFTGRNMDVVILQYTGGLDSLPLQR